MRKMELLRKLPRNSQNRKRPKSIAVVGTEENVGVTHFCIMLANFLKKARYRVAVLECNECGDFLKIENAYEGTNFIEDGKDWFKIRGIMFYKNIAYEKLSKIYQSNFDYIILDIGRWQETYKEEANRADKGFVIGEFSDWKREIYKEFVERQENKLTNRYQLLIKEGDVRDCSELSNLTGYKTGSIPFQKDPFITNKNTKGRFRKIMGV